MRASSSTRGTSSVTNAIAAVIGILGLAFLYLQIQKQGATGVLILSFGLVVILILLFVVRAVLSFYEAKGERPAGLDD